MHQSICIIIFVLLSQDVQCFNKISSQQYEAYCVIVWFLVKSFSNNMTSPPPFSRSPSPHTSQIESGIGKYAPNGCVWQCYILFLPHWKNNDREWSLCAPCDHTKSNFFQMPKKSNLVLFSASISAVGNNFEFAKIFPKLRFDCIHPLSRRWWSRKRTNLEFFGLFVLHHLQWGRF